MPHKETIRLLAFGDAGTGSMSQNTLASAMESRCKAAPYNAILLLGDVVYPDGVNSVMDARWRTHVFEPYGSTCLENVPFFPVLGNHDHDGDTDAWLEMAAINHRWIYPGPRYRVISPGLVDIYAFDSSGLSTIGFQLPGRALGSPNPWQIAIGHHPIISDSVGPRRHQGGGISGQWMRRLLCEEVDLYISGHAHHMEHINIPGCRTDQFISGAAGGALSGFRGELDSAFAGTKFGFLEIEISKSTMTSRFITGDLEIAYEITKNVPGRGSSKSRQSAGKNLAREISE